jgi:hypothetical protein
MRKLAIVVAWITGAAATILFAAGCVAYVFVAAAGKGGHAGYEAWNQGLWFCAVIAAAVCVLAIGIWQAAE